MLLPLLGSVAGWIGIVIQDQYRRLRHALAANEDFAIVDPLCSHLSRRVGIPKGRLPLAADAADDPFFSTLAQPRDCVLYGGGLLEYGLPEGFLLECGLSGGYLLPEDRCLPVGKTQQMAPIGIRRQQCRQKGTSSALLLRAGC